MIEERSQPTGAYIFYTTYLFHTLFLIMFLLPSGHLLHTPPNFFISATPLFATQFRNSHSRLIFTTQLRDSHS